jgi:uncharacterized protein YndB with AHSA1/START domain
MSGKHKTVHTVSLEATVSAAPEVVYRLWTTDEGVRKFFAPEARIDARRGGEYTILFAPHEDPRGYSHGTFGARILQLEPNRMLSFEWITFAGDDSLGDNAPPLAARAVRDVLPLPTWVELRFDPVDAGRATHITLRHFGFGSGPLWDASYAWFKRAWAGVLKSLEHYCASSVQACASSFQ